MNDYEKLLAIIDRYKNEFNKTMVSAQTVLDELNQKVGNLSKDFWPQFAEDDKEYGTKYNISVEAIDYVNKTLKTDYVKLAVNAVDNNVLELWVRLPKLGFQCYLCNKNDSHVYGRLENIAGNDYYEFYRIHKKTIKELFQRMKENIQTYGDWLYDGNVHIKKFPYAEFDLILLYQEGHPFSFVIEFKDDILNNNTYLDNEYIKNVLLNYIPMDPQVLNDIICKDDDFTVGKIKM